MNVEFGRAEAITAIVGATVIPLDRPGVLRDWTVLTRGEAVVAMGPSDQAPVPDDSNVVDAGGRFLMPGLVDMHVHIGSAALQSPDEADELSKECADELVLHLANGVTTVRNMWGAPFHLRLAEEVAEGVRPGPRLRTTSPIIDGSPPVWPTSVQATDPAMARTMTHQIRDEGYEAIKIYNHLRTDVFEAFCDEGRRVGLPVVGHVPFAVGIHGALAAGQRSIEHFRGYDFDPGHPPGASAAPERFQTWLTLSGEQLAAYAGATQQAETWNCPTLVVVDAGVETAEKGLAAFSANFRYAPRAMRERMRRGIERPVFTGEVRRTLGRGKGRQLQFLRMLHEAGKRLLVGTDCSVMNILPGFSLHDELANFVAAGLTPHEALVCCCRNPALFYGDANSGRIGVGCAADFVLLDGNPLEDIANTRRVAGVMTRGRWFLRETLQSLLSDVASRNPLSEIEEGFLASAQSHGADRAKATLAPDRIREAAGHAR